MKENPFNDDCYLEEKFLEIKNNFNIDTVIETGTFQGSTTFWFSKHFKNVHTIESQQAHFDEAKKWIGNIENIQMYLGDSPKLLKNILSTIDDTKTILFLDAHWYENPLLSELETINDSGKLPIIAIHDFMVPGYPELGYDVYSHQGIVYNWEWIQSHINAIFGENGYTKEYNTKATGSMRGCIFIFPAKK